MLNPGVKLSVQLVSTRSSMFTDRERERADSEQMQNNEESTHPLSQSSFMFTWQQIKTKAKR